MVMKAFRSSIEKTERTPEDEQKLLEGAIRYWKWIRDSGPKEADKLLAKIRHLENQRHKFNSRVARSPTMLKKAQDNLANFGTKKKEETRRRIEDLKAQIEALKNQ